jgi:hypothetical protein
MSSPTLREFGIKLECDPATQGMERVAARVLPPPTLLMGNNLRLRPEADGFFKVREDALFLRPALVESWVIYSHLPRSQVEEGTHHHRIHPENTLSRFVEDLRAQAQGRGLTFPDRIPPIIYRDDAKLCEDGHNPPWSMVVEHCRAKALKEYRMNATLIVVCLDGNGNSREYTACKEACLTVGLMSQCISIGRAKLGVGARVDDKGRRAYIGNLLLKVMTDRLLNGKSTLL